jgi:threonine/homoserine/homoserine lactone efflux protein
MMFGRKSGLIVTLGLATGLIFHTTIVALGLSVVFKTSLIAFNLLKYLGAIYLLYLAWMTFRRGGQVKTGKGESIPPALLYRRGIFMNVTNPKVSVFFLAFLTQFTKPSNGSVTLQIFILGLIFIAATLIVFGSISQVAGIIGGYISRSDKITARLNRIAGTVYLCLALKLAFTEH